MHLLDRAPDAINQRDAHITMYPFLARGRLSLPNVGIRRPSHSAEPKTEFDGLRQPKRTTSCWSSATTTRRRPRDAVPPGRGTPARARDRARPASSRTRHSAARARVLRRGLQIWPRARAEAGRARRRPRPWTWSGSCCEQRGRERTGRLQMTLCRARRSFAVARVHAASLPRCLPPLALTQLNLPHERQSAAADRPRSAGRERERVTQTAAWPCPPSAFAPSFPAAWEGHAVSVSLCIQLLNLDTARARPPALPPAGSPAR
jgi:hypothetical protein